jgi:glycosyltransferase involved in cell wall biosynthesis
MESPAVRVGINARYLSSPVSGIERYIAELMRHAPTEHCEFYPRKVVASMGREDVGGLLRRLRPLYNGAWDRYMELLEGRQSEIDLFHAPSFVVPRLARTPAVVTVHDLAFRIFPEFFDRRTRAYYAFFLEASLREAARIICVSESTAADLLRMYPFCRKKLRVVYNGFTDFSTIAPDDSVLDKLDVRPDDYLLCVGAFNARKNISAVVSLVPLLLDRFPRLKLVVVGRVPDRKPENLHPAVTFTGHVSDAALSSLYRNAALFVYPSKYEGFGFPLLEAMSVGTPVIYAKTSCLPEIAGLDDSHSFSPDDRAQILERIVGLLRRGRAGVDVDGMRTSLARFSWRRMCNETVEVYRECLR